MKSALLLVLAAVLFSCKSQSLLSDDQLHSKAVEAFGESVSIVKNQTGTMAICFTQQKASPSQPYNALTFGIMDLKTGELVYQEEKHEATVSWQDENTVKVDAKSEVNSTDESTNKKMNQYFIDVNTLEKRYTPSNLNQ